MTKIHIAAQKGYSVEAQTYARGRPEYPSDILPWLKGNLGVTTGKLVVDLGAGTGKFTKLLAQTGANVIAVEPVEEMYLQLEKTLPGVRVLHGRAEAIPLDTGSVDALVCAQAFHWFASEAALREIHRVLKPSGKLGLIWNVRDESVDWVLAITKIITPYEGDAPRFYKGDWRKPFNGRYFTAPEKTSFEHQHAGTAQQVILDRFLSVSFIAALPDDEKLKVAEQLHGLIASHPALYQKGEIVFPYRTEAYLCIRLEEITDVSGD
jgi:SAM-dependent methyltransferase